MQVSRRWIRSAIETARAETGPHPLRRVKTARRAARRASGAIRSTLQPESR